MEVRYIDNNYNPSQEADQPRKMEGYAILFNVESNVLYDPERKRYFREVIAPYAVTQELIDNSDIKFLFNHDGDELIARRRNGKGSLNVELREDGVYFSFEVPNTTMGNNLWEMVRRGDVSQCSFAFKPVSDKWDFSDEIPLRTITEIGGLYDLSAVVNPAYDETEITARNIEAEQKKANAWRDELNEYRKKIID